jgi:glycosyltransferase involved in cell wall biosynthesis
MRIAIIEEELPSNAGHWQPYMVALAEGFGEFGEVVTLGREKGEIAPGVPLDAVFSRSTWKNPLARLKQPFRALAKLWQPVPWAAEMRRWLRSAKACDLLYAPNQLPFHILAWVLVLASLEGARVPRLALGMNYFGGQGSGGTAPSALFRIQVNLARRLMGGHVKKGRVQFFCEDERAQKWLQDLFGWEFTMLPHPVHPDPRRPEPVPLGSPPHLIALGVARYDKGSDLLQEAAARVIESGKHPELRFTIQWCKDFEAYGKIYSKQPTLAASPQVEFIDCSIDEVEISRRLAGATMAVLPYRLEYYWARLSRVVIDAMTSGLPVIAPEGTSLAALARQNGALITFQDADPVALAQAIGSAVERNSELLEEARSRRAAACQYYSGANLARLVLGRFNLPK